MHVCGCAYVRVCVCVCMCVCVRADPMRCHTLPVFEREKVCVHVCMCVFEPQIQDIFK